MWTGVIMVEHDSKSGLLNFVNTKFQFSVILVFANPRSPALLVKVRSDEPRFSLIWKWPRPRQGHLADLNPLIQIKFTIKTRLLLVIISNPLDYGNGTLLVHLTHFWTIDFCWNLFLWVLRISVYYYWSLKI